MKIVVRSMDGDGLVDIVLPGKTGLYLFKTIGEAPAIEHELQWPAPERGYYCRFQLGTFAPRNPGRGVSRSNKVGVAENEKLANWKRH